MRHRPAALLVWFVLVALVFSTGLAGARGALVAGDPAGDVCRFSGDDRYSRGTDPGPDRNDGPHSGHCVLCIGAMGSDVAPPPACGALPLVRQAADAIETSIASPVPSDDVAASLARGPPGPA
jgi:hypothetical protein